MTTSIIPTSPQEIMTYAKAFAESGLFADTRQAAQAFVKIQAGAEMGVGPFAAMSGMHIINGKAVPGANVIAGRIKASGKYDYAVTEISDAVCKIEFYEGKRLIGVSSFSFEQAKKAGVKNLEKFPQNMLFAGAMSNGAKWYTPDVFGGMPVYSEGEIEVQDVPHEVVRDTRPPAPSMTKKEAADAMAVTIEQKKAALEEWIKAMDNAQTVEDYTGLRVAMAKDPGLKALTEKEKFHYLTELAKLASERDGIDYDMYKRMFFVRETGETASAEITEAEVVA